MDNRPKEKIFILRNNDLGDVLVATPLIQGLRQAFPGASLSMGVGKWAFSLLQNNPEIDQVIPCNAPWHNKSNCRYPANSPKTFLEGLLYVMFSGEARRLKSECFSRGIDVLGSRQGSWLMRRAKIPRRFGVKGYAGGDGWCESCVAFREDRNVALAALDFLTIMGKSVEIEPRPRIFLTEDETSEAEKKWGTRKPDSLRIVIAPGAGFPEKGWGDESFGELSRLLVQESTNQLTVIGGPEDSHRIRVDPALYSSGRIANLCGQCSVRQSAALVARADFVVTNSSLAMHLAGAFKIPSLTLLGNWYDSAKLHSKQWGYPESSVLGREVEEGVFRTPSPNQVFAKIRDHESIVKGA